jgi:16S rRNA processing protein RimM
MDTILIGQITKVSGFEGAVTVKTERFFSGKIPESGPVFIEFEGRPVPFFVEYSELLNDGLFRIKFEDYNSVDKIKEFIGCSLSIQTTSGKDSNKSASGDLTGFILESDKGKTIGKIFEVSENPGQYLLKVIDEAGKECLVPLHEDLILSIDPDGKKIIMTLPEGLTDLNC